MGISKQEPPSSDLEARAKAEKDVEPAFSRDVTIGWDWYYDKIKLEYDRFKVYKDIDKMDEESTEASSAFDAYADSALTGDSRNEKILNVQSGDEKVAKLLNDLIRTINLDAYIWGIVRNVAKYGDDFEEIVVDSKLNIARLKSLPPHQIIRNEDDFGYLPDIDAFFQYDIEEDKVTAKFDKWQIIHFRSQRRKHDMYGTSFGKSARKAFAQLCLMEDAIIIARLTRANMRLIFAIDVEGMDEETARAHINKAKDEKRKARLINPLTGKIDLVNNPLSVDEDIFIGVRKDSKAGVTPIQGDINISSMKDIEYVQNKFIAGLGVPKAYLGWERDVGAKATLTEQDIMFARRIRRLQYILQEGLRQLFDFNLRLKNIDPNKVSYTIGLPTISTVDSLREWRTEKLKTDIAGFFKNTLWASDDWVLRNVLGRTEDEIKMLLTTQEEPKVLPVAEPVDNKPKPTVNKQDITPDVLNFILEKLKDEIRETNELIDLSLSDGKDGTGVY